MYDLLGNDVEEDAAPSAPSREVVKKNTSSKKSDAAPASADPAKAKKKKSPTGNEAALKTRTSTKMLLHLNPLLPNTPRNLSIVIQEPVKPILKRNCNKDGAKVTRELEGEVEGTEDAEAELEAEAEENDESANAIPKKSLQEYLAELELSKQELEGSKKLRQANEGAEQNGPPKKRSKSNKKFSLLLLTPRKLNPRPKRKRSF